MTKAQSASFARLSEVRAFDHGRLLLVNLGDEAVGRQVLEPGWRWSVHVQPVVGTAWCEIHHIGLMMLGRLRAEMADGSVLEVGPDEVYELPPGHDAWVVGNEPAVTSCGASVGSEPFSGLASPEIRGEDLIRIRDVLSLFDARGRFYAL